MNDALTTLVDYAEAIAWFVIGAGALQNLLYLIQLVLAGVALSQRPSIPQSTVLWRRYAEASPPIALLAPAYNEALTIVQSVRSLLSLRYPSFEVIVINDGSSDATLQTLIDAYGLRPIQRHFDLQLDHRAIRGVYGGEHQPRLIVVDKENGGKADALNAGINVSRAPIFCSMDADSLLEPDALLRAVRPFVEDPERTVAVGGTVRIANGCEIRDGRVIRIGLPRSFLALLQTVEYLRAFLMARLAWSRVNALTIISGAFGLFRRARVIEAGGYTLVGGGVSVGITALTLAYAMGFRKLHLFENRAARDAFLLDVAANRQFADGYWKNEVSRRHAYAQWLLRKTLRAPHYQTDAQMAAAVAAAKAGR